QIEQHAILTAPVFLLGPRRPAAGCDEEIVTKVGVPPLQATTYGVDASCGSHRRRDFFSLSALKAGQSHLARLLPCLSSVIPAQAGIQRPKNRPLPLDSRLRGNDGNREVGEPKFRRPCSPMRPRRG